MNNCPCDLQSNYECQLCRDKDTAEKERRRYEVNQVKAIRDKICDKCREELYQRGDDADETAIEKRLGIYHNETEPILERYKDYFGGYGRVKTVPMERMIQEEIANEIMKTAEEVELLI